MTNMPIENLSEVSLQDKTETLTEDEDNTYGYNDNLTAKLGGNYSKIIEFYEDKL